MPIYTLYSIYDWWPEKITCMLKHITHILVHNYVCTGHNPFIMDFDGIGSSSPFIEYVSSFLLSLR
jgi:hypothetical protein